MKKSIKKGNSSLYFLVMAICCTILPINGYHPDSSNLAGRTIDLCCKEVLVFIINSYIYCYISERKRLIFDTKDSGFFNLERNETGHILSKEGIFVEMLDWLAIAMQFK